MLKLLKILIMASSSANLNSAANSPLKRRNTEGANSLPSDSLTSESGSDGSEASPNVNPGGLGAPVQQNVPGGPNQQVVAAVANEIQNDANQYVQQAVEAHQIKMTAKEMQDLQQEPVGVIREHKKKLYMERAMARWFSLRAKNCDKQAKNLARQIGNLRVTQRLLERAAALEAGTVYEE